MVNSGLKGLLYGRTSSLKHVNEAHQALFSQDRRSIENIPPTEGALYEHIKTAAYRAGQIWGLALVPLQHVPSATDWGWEQSDSRWKPI